MFGETTIFYVKVWNHPTETTIYKQVFQVPGRNVQKILNVFYAKSWMFFTRFWEIIQRFLLVGKPYHQQHLGFPYPYLPTPFPLPLGCPLRGVVEKVGEISLSSPSPSHQNPASRLDFALFARHLVRVDGDLTVGPGCPVWKFKWR